VVIVVEGDGDLRGVAGETAMTS
jgi:hypothetical protein